jgi:superoxide dismutase, Fe-Mn family
MQRREFLTSSLAAGAALASLNFTTRAIAETAPQPAATAGEPAKGTSPSKDSQETFVQPPLPYELTALAPFLKEEQMNFHFNKHHAGYFKKLNSLVAGKPEAKMSLEELVTKAEGGIFNNAAQAWNHTFFWNSLSPKGGGVPQGPILEAMNRDFGGLEPFKKSFSEAAVTLFGSGWAWLAADKDRKLKILALSNADNPLRQGLTPILTLDVWEHSYYIDYRNDRAKYTELFWSKVNWDFAGKNFAALAKA